MSNNRAAKFENKKNKKQRLNKLSNYVCHLASNYSAESSVANFLLCHLNQMG